MRLDIDKRLNEASATIRLDPEERLKIAFSPEGYNAPVNSTNELSFYVSARVLPSGAVALEIALDKAHLYEREPYKGEHIERYILSDSIGADEMTIKMLDIPSTTLKLTKIK